MAENLPRSGKILKFVRPVNGVPVEQRRVDGFINGTAMCMAHSRRINAWFRTRDTLEFFVALAMDLGTEIMCSDLSTLDVSRLSAAKYAEIFLGLIVARSGSPENGGGAWLHPDLAIQLAQWCNKSFSIQVSRWIREWLLTGQNPIQSVDVDLEQEWQSWQQRYDIRIELKDFLRPELMTAVARWAEQNGKNPRTLCSQVHDAMNERIQGAKSRQIRLMGGLPLASLIRDYFETSPLRGYSAINQLAKNAIIDSGVEPLQAVHDACDRFLGKTYVPKLVPIAENLYAQGRRLRAARKQKQLQQGHQLSIWEQQNEAC